MNQQTANISNERLMSIAPSIFAEHPYEEVSDKYTFIPTSRIVNAMRENNWSPVRATQSDTRIIGKDNFTKHMIRFRHNDFLDIGNEVGDTVPELVLFNSHDAGSSFRLHAGIFRKVCSNGMVVADSTFAKVCVHHKGDIIRDVIEGSFKVLETVPQVLDEVRDWQNIETSPEEREVLASAILKLKYKEGDSPITPQQLTRHRRYGDDLPDLWTQFNVMQENFIKGGQRGIKRDDNGRGIRRVTTRPVKAPEKEIGLNAAMWELTKQFAELKAGA